MSDRAPQIGGKIRRLRRQKELSQVELAGAVGISPSYLNLLEHNRRKVTVALLFAFSDYFGIAPGELGEGDEGQLLGDLMEAFGDELFADFDLTNQEVRDFAFANPVVGRAVLRLFDGYRDRAGRESGAIEDNETRPPATEAISDFLQENANHFPPLEEAAERVREDVDRASDSFELGLSAYLENVFDLRWRSAPLPKGLARQLAPSGRVLQVSETMPRESATFSVAHHLAQLAASEEIEAILEGSSLPEEALGLARNALASYFAGALLMPYEPFLQACKDLRYDVERLEYRFHCSFEQVCHRMTTLQRPGQAGVPMHLIRTDVAGNISKRFSLSGIHIPRHAGACPRWNVHTAFLQPGRLNVQISEMPDGRRFFCLARSIEKGGHGHNAPRRQVSIGLGCDIVHARKLVYSDGLDLKAESQVVPIGVTCTICPRRGCEHRAHPPADHRYELDPTERPETLLGSLR